MPKRNYLITPKTLTPYLICTDNPDDVLPQFATVMDSDMNTYFAAKEISDEDVTMLTNGFKTSHPQTKVTTQSEMRRLKKNDKFTVNNENHIASCDAYMEEDDNTYIVYDENDEGWFEDDFPEFVDQIPDFRAQQILKKLTTNLKQFGQESACLLLKDASATPEEITTLLQL